MNKEEDMEDGTRRGNCKKQKQKRPAVAVAVACFMAMAIGTLLRKRLDSRADGLLALEAALAVSGGPAHQLVGGPREAQVLGAAELGHFAFAAPPEGPRGALHRPARKSHALAPASAALAASAAPFPAAALALAAGVVAAAGVQRAARRADLGRTLDFDGGA